MISMISMIASLAEELDALVDLPPLRLLLWFSFSIGLVWSLAVGLPLGIRIAWQLGLDPRRRLVLASSLSRFMAPFVALLGLLEPFFIRAPMISLIGLVTLVTLMIAASPSSARNLAAGLGLALRAHPRPGDLIQIGALEGTVDYVGLMRVSLRTREGGVTLVPTADFERLPVTIGSHGAAVPVEVDFQPNAPLDDAMLERLRRALWFSPFRRAGTEVRVVSDPVSGRLHVAIDTWAARSSAELERHLRELLHRNSAAPEPRGPNELAELGATELADEEDNA